MSDKKDLIVANGTIRKILGAAICDLAAYVSSSKEPFITGGQYPNTMLLDAIKRWCFDRKLDLTHPEKAEEVWLSLCDRGLLAGDKTFEHPPKPIRRPPPPPNPKPPVPPPKPPSGDQYKEYKDGDQNDAPAGESDEDEDVDDWKNKEDRKSDWRDEGEDWKKGDDDDKT